VKPARHRLRHLTRLGAPLVIAATLLLGHGAGPGSAAQLVPVSGSGSTWSANAISQWISNVAQYHLTVNYQSIGSSDGRTQFRNGSVDFAVSEIPYGLRDGNTYDTPPTRGYAYMPIVAGGTSLMYNLKIGNRTVTNLRLSGETVTKIFTGVITDWADPQVARDNPGLNLPHRRIVPVVRADGSGTTAQFSLWMSKKFPSLWDSYCAKAGRPTPCGMTSTYPVIPGRGFVALGGSNGVSGFVKQQDNIGTITYVEYSYAINSGYPVAKLLNRAGYYVEPTAANVAVGLLQARINTTPGPSYLTQILDGVYDNPDPRAYPMSSYSYMILPTKVENNFSTAKGVTLSKFANYFLCEGQQQADDLGYSPLPINLVQAGMAQVRRIPGADQSSINIKSCNNPTFSSDGSNTLAKNAPMPSPCDRIGVTQCTAGTGGAKSVQTPVKPSARPSAAAGAGPRVLAGGASSASAGPSASGGARPATSQSGTVVAGPQVDPLTGATTQASADGNSQLVASPVSVAPPSRDSMPLGALVAALLLAVIIGPPTLARAMGQRGRDR
jgi:phosphate ABC transporter phosphate-binding protein